MVTDWQGLEAEVALPDSMDSRMSAEVLRGLLADLGYQGPDAQRLFASISGITGAVNGQRSPVTPEALFALLLARFSGARDLSDVAAHPDFRQYLAKRAIEMVARRRFRL
jgi:hypothetical protein